MSWIFSRSLMAAFESLHCSQEQEAESSADTCSDGVPFAPSSANPMPQAYCSPGRMTAFSRISRSGMKFAPLTEDRGADLLTWFLADSRVRTYPLPGMVRASMASAQGCGKKWRELSARYDLDSSSWKIHLSLFPEDLPWSSVTLPKWGMTQSGFVYQHPTVERPISATASGLWQTPVADDAVNRKIGKWNSRGEPKLSGQVLSPTHWPTPVASMSKGSSPASLTRASGADRSNDRLDHAVMASDGGQLNPTWVEWLMGWPLGWTDLKPLEMGKFQEWRLQHFDC